MNTEFPQPRRGVTVALLGAIGLAMVGFLVGIGDGVAPPEEAPDEDPHEDAAVVADSSTVIPAATYSEMRRGKSGPTSKWEPQLEQVHSVYDYQRCITCHDPHTLKISPSEQDKRRSLETRSKRRAFNGAPPVIPHAVEKTDDAACYACHGAGMRIGDRVANRMSHRFLVNCLQCHAPPAPKPFTGFQASVSNTFVGLPTPNSGARAFPGAPPVIPHSTWMREKCLSCHGGVVGWAGLEVTHRWRTNCTQCHAVSARFEQGPRAEALGLIRLGEGGQP